MKKMMSVLALLLLLTSCAPEPEIEPAESGCNLPYRVWESWAEMKEVLGDHYLYPTYLPEFADQSERPILRSWFNLGDRDRDDDELFFGYLASFSDNVRMSDHITIQATDSERRKVPRIETYPPFFVPFHGRFQDDHRFNEHTVTIAGIDIEFISFYAEFSPPEGTCDPDEWFRYQARNGRAILYSFKIGTVTYEMSWVQFNVEDKYADDEQREAMIRVATSIIEQVKEIE